MNSTGGLSPLSLSGAWLFPRRIVTEVWELSKYSKEHLNETKASRQVWSLKGNF
jgi:hypothetical protein